MNFLLAKWQQFVQIRRLHNKTLFYLIAKLHGRLFLLRQIWACSWIIRLDNGKFIALTLKSSEMKNSVWKTWTRLIGAMNFFRVFHRVKVNLHVIIMIVSAQFTLVALVANSAVQSSTSTLIHNTGHLNNAWYNKFIF